MVYANDGCIALFCVCLCHLKSILGNKFNQAKHVEKKITLLGIKPSVT